MSRTRNSVSAQIRERMKASQDERVRRENVAARKRVALDERFSRGHYVERLENVKVPRFGVRVHNEEMITDTVVTTKTKTHETSPGVYVVNVNSADPTGEQYFENSGRLERIRKIVAKKHARKASPA